VECCFFIINFGKMNQCYSLCELVKTFLIKLEERQRQKKCCGMGERGKKKI
jgi:hypothetical protein